jgi:iron complex outermembrane receptor protein
MFQPIPSLFFKGSYRYLDLDFFKDPGSPTTSNGNAEGNDAKHLAILGAHLDLSHRFEADAFLRYASDRPDPAVPSYTTLDLRLGWRPNSQWEISVTGRNLLEPQFVEFVTTNSLNEQVHRSVTAKVTWRY